MASNVNVLSGVGLGVLLMAMIMSIVSLVTDHWTEISKPQSGMYFILVITITFAIITDRQIYLCVTQSI